jgi:hypothetical protein
VLNYISFFATTPKENILNIKELDNQEINEEGYIKENDEINEDDKNDSSYNFDEEIEENEKFYE